jgi:hypothetical protein
MTLYIIAGGVSKIRNRAKKSSMVSRSPLILISVYSHLLERSPAVQKALL